MKYQFAKSWNPFHWLPRISVMDRYIMSELTAPFLFGLGAFASLGVSIGSVFDLVRKVTDGDISFAIAVKVFFLQIPYFLSFAFPTAILLATLLAYSRLASDSELIAMRSCGVSVARLLAPALAVGLLVTGVTFAFNEMVVPAAKYEATLTLKKAITDDSHPLRDETNILYPEYRERPIGGGDTGIRLYRLFYAEEFNGDRMKNVTILDYSQPSFKQLILASSGSWNVREQIWDFYNGTIYILDNDGSYRRVVTFDHHRLLLPKAPIELASERRDYSEMNILQAMRRRELLRYSGNEDEVRKLTIRIQQKLAIPFACVAFALVGTMLGMKPDRTSKATGFGISVVVIFSYYLLMSIGDALGLSGAIPPALAGWLPTLCTSLFGLFLLWRFSR
ncbi:LptF/LptG family permease [Geitlerinema sp. PCC 9228]|jgi:lipopolysaccharide export system permease protein|uniref:LptF/LptG family permease n=1 Tax=Geitlerinema sp. PCC 9228 TaxID=111611 RepID=UPI0008F99ABB|nr:LptF/LptG family permease [Geitlerinema sp. PCC 9228]